MKLAVVIIHYNTSGDLERCLASLAAYPSSKPFETVVVDNNSVDGGLADVRQRYSDCRWIINSDNVGYARGCNQGMEAVEAEYYLVLNPDIVVQPVDEHIKITKMARSTGRFILSLHHKSSH